MKKIFISIALMIAGCAIGQAQFSVKYDSEVQPKDNIQYFTQREIICLLVIVSLFIRMGFFICIGCLMKDIIRP